MALAAWVLATPAVAGPVEAPPASPPVPVEIEVAEDPAADAWQVTYRFAEPVAGIVFQRGRQPFRAGAWELRSPGATWRVHDSRDAVLAASGGARELRLRFASDFEPREKEYELNVSYTDGGRLVYTGHLSVRPLVAGGAGLAAGRLADHRWRFRTAGERWIVVRDRAARGELDWQEEAAGTGDGTYAYFGPRPPDRRERMTMLLDPGLPEWMRVRAEWILPRLTDRFAAETGVELAFRPLVMISFRPADTSGLTFSGGTLDGLVQMSAIGRAWRQQTAEADAMWLDRTAHEIFHFWAGESFVAALEDGDAWLTEGAADLFALEAMLGLGLIDEASRRRRLVEAANRCLVGLEGEPLLASAEPGRFANMYACGSTLWLWAGAAVAEATGGEDGVAALTRELFAASGGELTTYRFLETVHRLTGSPWAGAPLARLLLDGVAADADAFFLAHMQAAGLPVRLAPPAGATLRPGSQAPAPHRSWSRLLALDGE